MPEPVKYGRLNPPERTLLGPDLSNASPRAHEGLTAILEGANDPSFLKVLDEALALLRHLWDTRSADTFIIPGSEETVLEAALMNILEPGDTAVIGVAGFFGERMAQAAERIGAKVQRLVAESGKAVSDEAFEEAIKRYQPRLVAVLHGEGSTGVEQPIKNLARIAHAGNALLLVDTRWTISALECSVDALEIDVCIAGSQKAISAYPGLGLISFSERAAQAYAARKTPVLSWSLDLGNLRLYRTDERAAQTYPAPILYALTELLQLVYEQGMAYRIRRMINRRDAIVAGLDVLGLQVYADPSCRLSTVTAVVVPEGIDQDQVRKTLLNPYRIDIGGGLGDLRGKLWRIGVLGHSAQPTFLLSLIHLLEIILHERGYPVQTPGKAGEILLAHLEP
ncbi:MAG TPA: aminotransferase class V-fold PLP-dependent enzyme [Phototrophicaceae bacterium]|nr:aminotransferase class V-fold PLP-dependent enzyme [Phototrophicaceae bacterium]